ncbi:MAG: GFA family protein [Kordiimonadaceae bacterium]|nr:GFA family protein [Kordiimonadaceae bacterium]
MSKIVTHRGSCHCGSVAFEVDAPADIEAVSCTCSMCTRTGFVHVIVGGEAFRITEGEDNLTEYQFNTRTAKHLFCKTCGVKAFYVPRSHPDGWSVNLNCIDPETITSVKQGEFDGASWEANIASIT